MDNDDQDQHFRRIDVCLAAAIAQAERIESRRHGAGKTSADKARQGRADDDRSRHRQRRAQIGNVLFELLDEHGRKRGQGQAGQPGAARPAAIQSLPDRTLRSMPNPATRVITAVDTIRMTLRCK